MKYQKVVEIRVEVRPSLDTRMWIVIIVTKEGTYKRTLLYEKGIAETRIVSRNIRIMMMMSVLLLLLLMILLFLVTMSQTILYHMRACG